MNPPLAIRAAGGDATRRNRRRAARVAARLGLAAGATGIAALVYRLVVSGELTLDTGLGRRVRPLGPITISIAAPPDIVFDVIAAPYLTRTPRALRGEIDVLERSPDMVLAAHRTPVGWGMTTTTVETVRFNRPDTISFRLLRGPVPQVVETFTLHDDAGTTRLDYHGELGADFWQPGRWWANQVARHWEATVATSLDRIRHEAERQAATRSHGSTRKNAPQ